MSFTVLLYCSCRLSFAWVSPGKRRISPERHVGRVLDWSYHHVIVGGGLHARPGSRTRSLAFCFISPNAIFRCGRIVQGRPGPGDLNRGDRRPIRGKVPSCPARNAI